jgi:hypothetical protein
MVVSRKVAEDWVFRLRHWQVRLASSLCCGDGLISIELWRGWNLGE